MNIKRLVNRFWLSPTRSNAIIPSLVLLIFRLAWGWAMVESGWGHWHHIGGTIKYFTSLGVPMPTLSVYVSATAELVGGALLMLGLFSRFITIALVVNFCVAYMANPDEVTHFFRQDPYNFMNDSAFPYLMASLLVLVFGAGLFSLDCLLGGILKHRKGKA